MSRSQENQKVSFRKRIVRVPWMCLRAQVEEGQKYRRRKSWRKQRKDLFQHFLLKLQNFWTLQFLGWSQILTRSTIQQIEGLALRKISAKLILTQQNREDGFGYYEGNQAEMWKGRKIIHKAMAGWTFRNYESEIIHPQWWTPQAEENPSFHWGFFIQT